LLLFSNKPELPKKPPENRALTLEHVKHKARRGQTTKVVEEAIEDAVTKDLYGREGMSIMRDIQL